MAAFFLEWLGVRVRIREGETVIGRGSDCELHLDDPTASRRHTAIHREGSTVTVTDLGSRNGTFVDASRIRAPQVLRGGERVLVGETVFTVLFLPPEAVARPAELSLGIGPGVAPGLALIERERSPFEHQHDVTAPHLGTVEVLEALLQSPHAKDEPQAVAAMVENSVERLLATMERRDDALDLEATRRLVAVLAEVESWLPDGSFGATVTRLQGRIALRSR